MFFYLQLFISSFTIVTLTLNVLLCQTQEHAPLAVGKKCPLTKMSCVSFALAMMAMNLTANHLMKKWMGSAMMKMMKNKIRFSPDFSFDRRLGGVVIQHGAEEQMANQDKINRDMRRFWAWRDRGGLKLDRKALQRDKATLQNNNQPDRNYWTEASQRYWRRPSEHFYSRFSFLSFLKSDQFSRPISDRSFMVIMILIGLSVMAIGLICAYFFLTSYASVQL